MIVNLNVEYDARKDMQNYVHSIVNSKSEYSKRKLLEYVDDETKNLLQENVSDENWKNILIKHLQKTKALEGEKSAKKLQTAWHLVGDQVIRSLELIYGRTFPFDSVMAYITTIPQHPYNFERRYFYTFYKSFPKLQLRTITHELSHFIFFHYYPEIEGLSKIQYTILKEALVFFTNPEIPGSKHETLLRDFYKSRVWGNMDEIIKKSTALLIENE